MNDDLQKLNNKPIQHIQREIVEFAEEGQLATSRETVHNYPLSFEETCGDALPHTVVDFLSRPIEAQNFTWNTSDAAGQELGVRTLLPEDWLSTPMVREKLSGFAFLKCGFKIRVQVNAMPFHQGRLLIIFDPLFQQMQYIPSNIRHFGGVTGFHRVDLDLSESTGAELHVPFRCNLPYFDLVRAIGHLGVVRIFVYSQLAGALPVEGTVWIEATDISVQMPTGVAPFPRAIAQGEFPESEKTKDPRASHATIGVQADPLAIDAPEFEYADDEYYEGDITIPQNVEVKEQQAGPSMWNSGKRGWGERGFSVARSICNALVGVPAIGSFGLIGSWVSGLAENVCSLYGWSKPRDVAKTTRIVPAFATDMVNFNGDSKAKVLALDSKNRAVIPKEVFGTDADEMALSHVLARPVFTARFTQDTTQVPNQIIFKWPVSPAACYKTTFGPFKVKLNTYLSYCSEMFKAWRGGIKYHFKVVKTRFHSTRIRIFFVPGVFEDTDITLIDTNKIYSKVVDIRDLTSFDFEVPFVYNQPWMSLKEVDPLFDQLSESLPTGMIYVEVLNTLVVGGGASNSIEYLIESSAGVDFQFGYHDVHSRFGLLPFMGVTGAKFLAAAKETAAATVRKIGNIVNIKPEVAAAGLTGSALKAKLAEQSKQRLSSQIVITDKKGKVVTAIIPPKTEVVAPIQPKPALPEKPIETPYTEPELPECPLPLWTGPLLKPDITPQGDEDLNPTHVYTDMDRKLMWKHIYETQLKDSKFSNLYELPLANKFNRKYPLESKTCKAKAQCLCHTRSSLFENAVRHFARAQADFFPTRRTRNLTPNLYGLGEAITSFRQILKRYIPLATLSAPAEGNANVVYPYISAGLYQQPILQIYKGVWDRVASLYRWQCGSVRVGLSSQVGNEPGASVIVANSVPGFENFFTGYTSQVATRTRTSTTRNVGFSLSYPKVEKFVEYQVPFYQRVPAVPTSVGAPVNSDLDQLTFGNDYVPVNNGTAIEIAHTQPLTCWLAIGEDFSYGYLIGPPLTAQSVL